MNDDKYVYIFFTVIGLGYLAYMAFSEYLKAGCVP